ncbi:hypothetical protein ACFO3U_08560 [Flavobacterium ponti]|uniref:Uncharacterized protein n=1 Tax=Flavobacterium ponti TaxID=665133 RepID=A0ABV9P6Z8_9FLAO
MKKAVLFFVLSSFSMFSQDVKDIIAKETCECSTKLDLSTMSSDDLELNFGLCMLESYNNHIDEFSESEKLDFENSTQMEKFGEQIALKMLTFCPDVILKLGEGYGDDESETSTDLSIEGTFNATSTTGSFFTISIKESNGKLTNLVLLDNFDNSYLIVDKVIKKNEAVNVTYYEVELFDMKLNRFVTTKIITNITKK